MINFFKKILRFILKPIAVLWEGYYQIRRACYNYGLLKRYQFKVPIISIGNLSFGGSGKTPFTLWIGKLLESKNKKVMILMRGYKGRLENHHGVLHSGRKLGFNPSEFGDEALVLSRNLKNATILIGKNRSQNLIDYFPNEKPDIVLLDDGHQHLKLERDLNIVLFDALLPLSSYQVAPLGYLREGLYALRDADAIIINRADLVPPPKIEAIKKLLKKYTAPLVPVALMGYKATGLFDSKGRLVYSPGSFKGLKVMALAGVASPESFFKMLVNYEMELLATAVFPDHHFYTIEELENFLTKASQENALVIATEKDIVKIKSLVEDLPVYYLGIEVNFMTEEDKISQLILAYC